MEEFTQAPLRYHEVDYYLIALRNRLLNTPFSELPLEVQTGLHEEAIYEKEETCQE
jgi:hypothetical protein